MSSFSGRNSGQKSALIATLFAPIPLEMEGTRRLHPDGRLVCPVLDKHGQPCGPCQGIPPLTNQLLEAIANVEETARAAEEAKRKFANLTIQYRDIVSKREKSHARSIINRRMPPEIMSTIFIFCVDGPENLEEEFNTRTQPKQVPLKLGSICRNWRDIAWSTPALWKAFSIRLDFHHKQVVDPFQIELTRQWLSRSGRLPLSIYIGMERPPLDERGPQFNIVPHPILEIVKQYAPRWQDLYLCIWTPWIAKLAVNPSQIPKLRTLGLCPVGPYLGQRQKLWHLTQMPCNRLYIHAESLVSKDRNLHRKFLTKLSICWDSVVYLNLHTISYDNCYQLLKLATQLTTLKIANINKFDTFPMSNQAHHSKLKHFSICGELWHTDLQSIYHFLSALHFPSLTELHYDVGPCRESRSQGASSFFCPDDFIERMVDLKKLSIVISNTLEGEKYVKALRGKYVLQELHLKDRDVLETEIIPDAYMMNRNFDSVSHCDPRPLLAHISATNLNPVPLNSNTFLPVLRSFTYENQRQPPWRDVVSVLGPLSEINHIRRRPLKDFRIICNTSRGIGVPNDILCQLSGAIRKAGINVSLQDGHHN